MSTVNLTVQRSKLERTRQRFISRQQFLDRCIRDIEEDFHKQYGPFEKDWQATLEASILFLIEIDDYLVERDLEMIRCDLLLGAIEQANTKYRVVKLENELRQTINTCFLNDIHTLRQQDENISNIRSVYKMISFKEEFED